MSVLVCKQAKRTVSHEFEEALTHHHGRADARFGGMLQLQLAIVVAGTLCETRRRIHAIHLADGQFAAPTRVRRPLDSLQDSDRSSGKMRGFLSLLENRGELEIKAVGTVEQGTLHGVFRRFVFVIINRDGSDLALHCFANEIAEMRVRCCFIGLQNERKKKIQEPVSSLRKTAKSGSLFLHSLPSMRSTL